jgi:hypothetical protein
MDKAADRYGYKRSYQGRDEGDVEGSRGDIEDLMIEGDNQFDCLKESLDNLVYHPITYPGRGRGRSDIWSTVDLGCLKI